MSIYNSTISELQYFCNVAINIDNAESSKHASADTENNLGFCRSQSHGYYFFLQSTHQNLGLVMNKINSV